MKTKEDKEMKLMKGFEDRLKKADFYLLFVVDDKGVGYASQCSKRGVSGAGIATLISRVEKEKQYLISLVENNASERMCT